jgi:hypothetical protein
LLLPHLVETPRSAHPNFDGIGFQAPVLRLLGVGGHGDGGVADVFDFVDGASFRDGAAGSVVPGERRALRRRCHRAASDARTRIAAKSF